MGIRQQAARAFILATFALTIYLLYLVFRPFLSAIAWAVFLATAFYPMHGRILRLARGRETLAAVLSTTIVVALVLFPAAILVSSVTQSVGSLLSDAGASLRAAANDQPAPAGSPAVAPGPGGGHRVEIIEKVETALSPWIDVSRLDLEGVVLTSARQIAQIAAAQGGALLQNALWTLGMCAIAAFTMVYFFREGSKLLGAAQDFLPLRPADKEAVFVRLYEVTRAVFYGVIMTSVIQAVLGGVGWALAGLPSAVTAGIGMFFCSLIPVGGTFLVWGPGALWLFFTGHPVAGTFLGLWGIGIVGLVDNILRPFFISGRTRMHTLLVFFGVLGGMAAFGVAGLFLGPLIITLFLFLIEVIRRDLFPEEAAPPPAS